MSSVPYLTEDEEPWPGPLWEPTVYDGSYPQAGGEPGDIYINRYKDPPLYYVFITRGDCKLIPREEIKEWVTGGLMKAPQLDPPSSTTGSSPPAGASVPPSGM